MTSTTTPSTPTLYLALELSQDKWLLACATQAAEKPRLRSVPARDLGRLADEIAKAKRRFRLPADAPVRTCYEAGRDGFWLHRALSSRGLDNVVVDASSIEVNRRHKRVKTDPVDAAAGAAEGGERPRRPGRAGHHGHAADGGLTKARDREEARSTIRHEEKRPDARDDQPRRHPARPAQGEPPSTSFSWA
jgi:transposase